MKRMFLAALLASCNATSGDVGDAGEAGACLTTCATPLASYCATATCPTAIPCTGTTVYSGCGYTLVFTQGQEQVWDTTGHLVAVYTLGVGTACCVGGPAAFEAPSLQGCTIEECDAGGE